MKKIHQPRKRFGQNFLQDETVISNIIRVLNAQKTDHFVEIGPGFGALTKSLLPLVKNLDVIELDRDLISVLKQQFITENNLKIFNSDALRFDFASLVSKAERLRIVGNLPYNISTPLLFHLFAQIHVIYDMHFMLQKEVVDRLSAKVGTKTYGRLSVMAQYYCRVEKLFEVQPIAFNPPPKVVSAVVRLTPHQALPYQATNIDQFAEIVKRAFMYRRKTVANALKELINIELLERLDINPKNRPEQLTVEQYVAMANILQHSYSQ